MSSPSATAPGVRQGDFRFRCIACGDVSDQASQDFRCAHCGDLLEIVYPNWQQEKPHAAQLKAA